MVVVPIKRPPGGAVAQRRRGLLRLLDEADRRGMDTSKHRRCMKWWNARELTDAITHWDQMLRLEREMDRHFGVQR